MCVSREKRREESECKRERADGKRKIERNKNKNKRGNGNKGKETKELGNKYPLMAINDIYCHLLLNNKCINEY